MSDVASSYRSMIAEQRSDDSAHEMLNMQLALFDKLDGMSTLKDKRRMMSMFDRLVLNTYVLSYVGSMRFNDFARYVESTHLYSGGIKGLTLNMVAAGNTMGFDVLQGFPGAMYAQAFADELRNLGLHCDVGATTICESGADHSHITAEQQPEHWCRTA
jgi:hypothetical protein